jgi:hypothetical protein
MVVKGKALRAALPLLATSMVGEGPCLEISNNRY